MSTLLYPRDPIHKASATNASVTRLLRTLGSVGRAECASQGGHQRRSRRNITRTRSKTGTTIDTVTKIAASPSRSKQPVAPTHNTHSTESTPANNGPRRSSPTTTPPRFAPQAGVANVSRSTARARRTRPSHRLVSDPAGYTVSLKSIF